MIDQRRKDPSTDQLFRAVLSLQTVDEDLCTIGELRAMAQRLDVARMLYGGNTYDEVVAHTGASTATISRVKRCLNYGADGYTLVLKNGCLSVNADGGDTDEC